MLWGCVEPEKQMKSSLQHEHCNEAQPAWRIGREPRTVYCTSGHLSNGDGVDSLAMDGCREDDDSDFAFYKWKCGDVCL